MKFLPKVLVGVSLAMTIVLPAQAEYPERNIKLIVPYSAGGGTDTMARTLAPELEKAIGKKVIIVNRPGAQGQIGMSEIATARADGYTLGLISTGDLLATEALVKDAGFDMKSFNYLSTHNISANALIVKKDSPFNNYTQFVAFAKANPGKLVLGVSGHTHVYEVIRQEEQAGFDVNYIRFSGGGKSRNALLGGHVDALMIDKRFIPTLAQSGAKALAVASEERFVDFPNVPTFKENNVDLINASRRAVVLPLGVKPERIEAIMRALDVFSGSVDFATKLKKINEVQQYLRGEAVSISLNNQFKTVKAVVDSNASAFAAK